MDSLGLPYVEAPGEAAFYGPKLDIQLADVMGHEETYSTIQVDFHLPNQFELEYIGSDGQQHRPVMIHRAIISTMERMVSYLIELYGGAFPVWLAPVQVRVLPVGEAHRDPARALASTLHEQGFRADVDDRDETVGKRIREAEVEKIPYTIVYGDRESDAALAVRERGGGQSTQSLAELVSQLATLTA
jgi:threonyl-tRNA synthetase